VDWKLPPDFSKRTSLAPETMATAFGFSKGRMNVEGLGAPAGGAERRAARANCVIFSWVLMGRGGVCGFGCVCVPKDRDTLPNFAKPYIP